VFHISILGCLEFCLGILAHQSPYGDKTGLDDLLVAQDVIHNAGSMLR